MHELVLTRDAFRQPVSQGMAVSDRALACALPGFLKALSVTKKIVMIVNYQLCEFRFSKAKN